MKPNSSRCGRRTRAIASSCLAATFMLTTFSGVGLAGDAAMAETGKAGLSAAADWHLKAANLESREISPDFLRVAAQHTAKRTAKVTKITEDEARKIALQTVPGEITAVAIEKKRGANRYVVEVVAKEDGSETDVIIDMETGQVLATEK